MLTNVKIVSAVRSRPLIQVSFDVPYFSIVSWHYLCWNLIINVTKLSVCNRSSLRSQGDVTGIVGCFALAPANLLLNTMRAHSIECIQLTDIAARPKKNTCSGYEETIRSLNHLLYISCDQSHSVKTSYMNRLSKTFRLFSLFCENCNIKTNVHSQLLLYMTSMSSYIWFSR